jgi:hypothetical protein
MKTILLLVTLISFAGCANLKNAKNVSQTTNNQTIDPKPIKAILGDNKQTSLPTTIKAVTLNANVLKIEIEYTGGCKTHQFNLVGSQMISKSLPPIRAINLIHTDDNEECKQLINDTLYFDLKDLAYKQEAGSVIKLNLEGWKEQIIYTYQ